MNILAASRVADARRQAQGDVRGCVKIFCTLGSAVRHHEFVVYTRHYFHGPWEL
jgi:hypothetical protein